MHKARGVLPKASRDKRKEAAGGCAGGASGSGSCDKVIRRDVAQLLIRHSQWEPLPRNAVAACPGACGSPSWDGESSAGRPQQRRTAGCLFLLFVVVQISLNEEKLL